MCRRDKSDIVAATVLELQHHFSEALVSYSIPTLLFPSLRDLVILTIYAPKVAVTEKNIAGTIRSGKARFFAKVRRVGGNNWQPAGITGSNFIP